MKIRFPVATSLALAILLVSLLLPGSASPRLSLVLGADKLAHALLFFALAVAIHFDFNLGDGPRIVVAIVVALVIAASTEALQLVVEGRSADPYDAMADMAGFIIGLIARRPAAIVLARAASALRRRY